MEKLIEFVRENPVLYDASHEDYMRTKLKDGLWTKIARQINFTDGNAAKHQWRKLRECHREAIRRQQRKSEQHGTTIRLWMYQKNMEFLKPFMKNRTSVGVPSTSAFQESQVEDADDSRLSEPPSVETNRDETDEPEKIKLPTSRELVVQKYVEDSYKRANDRDEMRPNLVAQAQKEASLQNDALHQFFMSMYNTMKGLPTKYQRQVKRKIFEAVSQAEDDAEHEPKLQNKEEVADSGDRLDFDDSSPCLKIETVQIMYGEPSSSTPAIVDVKIEKNEDTIDDKLDRIDTDVMVDNNSDEEDEVPQCQGCNEKAGQFVCANQWYCSLHCQVQKYSEHSNNEDSLTAIADVPSQRALKRKSSSDPESANGKAIQKLTEQLQQQSEIIQLQTAEISQLKASLEKHKTTDSTNYPSPQAKTLAQMQMRKNLANWTQKEKDLALSIFQSSPATYKCLKRQNIVLPEIALVREWTRENAGDSRH